MARSFTVAAVLITAALSTAGASASAADRDGREGRINADTSFWSMREAVQRNAQRNRDDGDSDSERRRGQVGRSSDDEDSDSERRRGRVASRDRDRDNDRFPRRRDAGIGGVAFDNGFNDGYDRGLADGRNRDRRDPARHGDYRSADRGYEGRLGSREQYRIAYRDGFRDGYERGYREGENSGQTRTGRIRWPWPF